MNNSVNVILHIISPVHIGSGTELDPFSYIIRGKELLLIDTMKWIDSFSDKNALYAVFEESDYIKIRKFIAENFDNEDCVLCKIPVENQDFIRTYHDSVSGKADKNQAIVNFMTRNPVTGTPYIPGSSIKGAMRTAIANKIINFYALRPDASRPMKSIDTQIFGNPANDPMKNLKIKDVNLSNFGSAIYEAKEHATKSSLTPKGMFEATKSLCMTGREIFFPLTLSLKNFRIKEKQIDESFIIDALNEFYLPKIDAEYEKFYDDPQFETIREETSRLHYTAMNLKANEAMMRVGHFSHIECITFDNLRNPQTPQKDIKGKSKYGNTRTLVNGDVPFGWVKLEFTGYKKMKGYQYSNWSFTKEKIEEMLLKQQKKEQDTRELEELAIRRAAEQSDKKKADKERQDMMNAMSPEEKTLFTIKDKSISEEEISAVLKNIDIFESEHKREVAGALKTLWIERGKWKEKGKVKQDKQFQKILKIKEILGEA